MPICYSRNGLGRQMHWWVWIIRMQDLGYHEVWLWAWFRTLTAPSGHHEADDVGNDDLRDIDGHLYRSLHGTHALTHGHPDLECELLTVLFGRVEDTLVRNHQVMKAYGETCGIATLVPNFSIRWRLPRDGENVPTGWRRYLCKTGCVGAGIQWNVDVEINRGLQSLSWSR